MKRFFAAVGLVAFIAACTDSNMISPVSRAAPGSSLHSPGDPPPPPLAGDNGSGDLGVGFSDASVGPDAQPIILVCRHDFPLHFSWSYLQATGTTNQVVHLTVTPTLTSSSTGSIDLHDIQNGKVVTHGTVSDALFSFTIQGTDFLDLTQEGFDAQVTGTLTDLTTGDACQSSANLTGTFNPIPTPG